LSGEESPYMCLLRSELLNENEIEKPLALDSLQDSSSRNPNRRIHGEAVKVLEAPDLADDYYLNLLDWSAQDTIAVGLNTSIYIQNTTSGSAIEMCDVGEQITSVQWSNSGSTLAVGSRSGKISLWDIKSQNCIREYRPHSSRIGCLSWHGQLLASGSRDRGIFVHDVRLRHDPTNDSFVATHRQEVCGLAWSPCGSYLASGGNDNKLNIWSTRSLFASTTSKPFCRFADHCAAVKALAWSPHERGILASGAGTADRTIRLWNCHASQTKQCLTSVETGSQVCALAFAKSVNELVSTHGYSLNEVCLWEVDSTAGQANRRLKKTTSLMGHSSRVLYLAMSPDGRGMLTGAGDHTLRQWKCFPALTSRDTFGAATSSSKRTFLPNSNRLCVMGPTTVR